MKEIFTKENVVNWVNSQPNDRAFNYFDNGECFFSSFAREFGLISDVMTGGSYCRSGNKLYWFEGWIKDLAREIAGLSNTFTIAEVKALLDN